MTRGPFKWTLESAYHLDVLAADLDTLREGIIFLEEKLAEAREDGMPDEIAEVERPLRRLRQELAVRERRLLGRA